jgi:hypothetical protein
MAGACFRLSAGASVTPAHLDAVMTGRSCRWSGVWLGASQLAYWYHKSYQ